MAATPEEKMEHPVRLIKKYPNRRLYDTKTSSYITLADVKQMVLKNEDFQVVDAKSNEDLSRQILLQIILDEESGGMPMFSSDLLSQMIRSYGSAMQGFMGSYLEKNLEGFQEMQKALQEQSQKLYGDNSKSSQEIWAQFMNMQGPAMQGLMQAYMEQSQKMFAQFQEQMQSQARNMFTGFPFPGFPPQAGRHQNKKQNPTSDAAVPKVGFVSLGCPKALVDSERILTQLRAEGYVTAPDYAGADLVIVNTCGFIDAAVEESLGRHRRGARRERQGRRDGLSGVQEGCDTEGTPLRAGDHRARTTRRGDEGGPRAPARSRTTRSPTWCRPRASSSRRSTTPT